jgi:predicted amidohydrolase YtcJ
MMGSVSMKKRMAWIVAAAALFAAGCTWFGQNADLVLRNGILYTGNDSKPQAEAMAVRGGRILLVGKNEDVDRFIGRRTQVVDLRGRFACAGFNDAHAHLLGGGKLDTEMDLSNIASVEEFQRRVLTRAWEMQAGTWLIGRGWDQTLFPGGVWPDKSWFDADIPVFLLRVCEHAAVVNRKALEIAGIRKDTPDPPAGEIVRDPATGEPTGILKEDAIKMVTQYIPALSKEGIIQAILKALDSARRFGITSVQDVDASETAETYQELLDKGKLTCRISMGFPLNETPEQFRRMRDRLGGPSLHFGLLKGFADGSMGARTAYFLAPYADDPSTRGIPLLTQEKLNLLVLRADRTGFQIGVHAIGDEANDMVLNAYALARRINGIRDSRHRIEHAQVLLKKDLPRFKELGITASMQPAHCVDDMRWAEARTGPKRIRYAYAWRSLLDHGAILAFGSDWPVASLDPLVGIHAAVTRQDSSGRPPGGFHPEEKITVREALDAYTKGSAYAERMEAEKGTLEKNKVADIVVLSRNLLTAPPSQILKTKVVMTICAGKIVYETKD